MWSQGKLYIKSKGKLYIKSNSIYMQKATVPKSHIAEHIEMIIGAEYLI